MSALQGLTIDDITTGFDFLEDWEQRFSYLLDLGKKLPDFSDDYRTEANKVHGCQSQVWLHAEMNTTGGTPTIHFQAVSDAHIVNGLIAILMTLYNDQPPADMLAIDYQAVFNQLDLEQHLSPTRRNGLHAMVQRIRTLAEQHA